MNRLDHRLSIPILLFLCLYLVSCRTTPSSCRGTLHRVAVNVSGSTVSVSPARLEVNGGDCIEWSVSGEGRAIERIEIQDPAGTRIVTRPTGIRLSRGTHAYSVFVHGVRAPTPIEPEGIDVNCFPPICIEPPEPFIQVFFRTP